MTITFRVPGAPQGKGRPRFTKGGITYTPTATRQYEDLIAYAYRLQGGRHFGHVPLRVVITAVFPVPKSYGKKVRDQIGAGIVRPMKKPDGDNIEKAVLDALNGIAYHDDIQVVELMWRKDYTRPDYVGEGLYVTITDEIGETYVKTKTD